MYSYHSAAGQIRLFIAQIFRSELESNTQSSALQSGALTVTLTGQSSIVIVYFSCEFSLGGLGVCSCRIYVYHVKGLNRTTLLT